MAQSQQEENMAEDEPDKPIFPVLNRRAPVLERIRNNGRGQTPAFKAGRLAGESVMNDDEEQLTELATKAKEDFKRGMAEALGVEPDNVNDDVASEFARLVAGLDENDALTNTTLESLGLLMEEDESGEEEEDAEDDDDDVVVDEKMVEEGEDVDPSGMF